MAEPMSQCLGWGQYFWFFWLFWFFQVKPKKTKWQNLCPSVWDGVSTFVFLGYFGFPGKTKKTKKNKMAEPMSQCLGWGQYFCFFWLFWFFQVKPKKQNGRTYVPVSGMGSVLFFGFSRFLQYSAFPKKTLVSFPKKIFFS